MPGFSGVEVLRRTARQPLVGFTTAYSQHAVTAFELGALDVLVKPFGAVRLASAMERVKSGLGEPAQVISRDRLADALGHAPMSRLFVRTGASLIPVAVADVAWFSADGDYCGSAHRHIPPYRARVAQPDRSPSRPREVYAHSPGPYGEPESRARFSACAARPDAGRNAGRHATPREPQPCAGTAK